MNEMSATSSPLEGGGQAEDQGAQTVIEEVLTGNVLFLDYMLSSVILPQMQKAMKEGQEGVI